MSALPFIQRGLMAISLVVLCRETHLTRSCGAYAIFLSFPFKLGCNRTVRHVLRLGERQTDCPNLQVNSLLPLFL